MKTYKIVILSVLLSVILLIGILLVGYVGLMYIGDKMFEQGWTLAESIKGPDGYLYCTMHETGVLQDPYTKLIRTKNIDNEETYEDLGSTNTVSSWLRVIRPKDKPESGNHTFYCTSNNNIVVVGHFNKVAFVYDINNNQFYDDSQNNEVSPFRLIDEDSVLYKPDVFWAIFLVIEDYHKRLEYIEYLKKEKFPEKYITSLDDTPEWPKPEMLKKGLEHPNNEVKKLSKWLIEIQENGFSKESESIVELIDYLRDNETSNNPEIREYISKIFGYTGWKE